MQAVGWQCTNRLRRQPTGTHCAGKEVTGLQLRRLARPEELSAETAYELSLWTVYLTDEKITCSLDDLSGRCCVVLDSGARTGPVEETRLPYDVYRCVGTLKGSKVGAAPKDLAVKNGAAQPAVPSASAAAPSASSEDGIALRTLDIFAGAANPLCMRSGPPLSALFRRTPSGQN